MMRSKRTYSSPHLFVHGSVSQLTAQQAGGKQPLMNDGQSGTSGLANSKCPGGSDGSQSTHNESENPLLCS